MHDDVILTNSDIAELCDWRRTLHQNPELSGQEAETAQRVIRMLKPTKPAKILTHLGGYGVAAVYAGPSDGPTLLLRCELDGLPISEVNPDITYSSVVAGKAHLCGHDGHMAIMTATARWLGRNPPKSGRVVLLYQPAEEDGSGAAKVLKDRRFAEIAPDYALSLHNFPGLPLGHTVIAPGPMNCASCGIKISLKGRTAHASQPELGASPAFAMADLIHTLTALSSGTDTADPGFSLVTVTHATLGEPAFGIAPGDAELWATLRTQKDDMMADLVAQTESRVRGAAEAAGLQARLSFHDIFRHCDNDKDAAEILRAALAAENIPLAETELPMRGSEDFGRFGGKAKAAMFLLGSGEECANLHNPDYDFPDALIEIGARVFVRAIRSVCSGGPAASAGEDDG